MRHTSSLPIRKIWVVKWVLMKDTPNIKIWLQSEPIDEQKILAMQASACGAFISFLGKTRQEHHDVHGELTGLHYTAHLELAKETLNSIAYKIAIEHGCHEVTICHRLGMVDVGESSVAVVVSAPHRTNAFNATAEIMNQLKSKVPVWKEEHWASGTTWSEGIPIT